MSYAVQFNFSGKVGKERKTFTNFRVAAMSCIREIESGRADSVIIWFNKNCPIRFSDVEEIKDYLDNLY